MVTSTMHPVLNPPTITPVIIDLRVSTKDFKKQNSQHSRPTSPESSSSSQDEFSTQSSLADTDSADSDSMNGSIETADSDFDNDESVPPVPGVDLQKMILSGLCPSDPTALKTIPTMVLYDDLGLQLYDEITYLEEYYLAQEEIEILERDGDKLVEHIPDNSVVVELGAGSLRKTALLLKALERKRKNIRYYALDLMLNELTKSLKSLGQFNNVKTAGLWGTYEQVLAFVSSFGPDVPKTLLWLGSSIGNLCREEAMDFIASYRKTLNVGDNWLIGIDRRNDPQAITLAYNDSKGVTSNFIMNGLDHINTILQQDFINRNNFRYFARYNVEVGRHEAYYQVKRAHELVYRDPSQKEIRIPLAKDEIINVEYSYKWSPQETTDLLAQTEFTRIGQWTCSSQRYDLHLVRKTPFFFNSTDPMPCPTQDEWRELHKSWDLVTMHMIQHPSMLLEKPIALRHPFLFYLGHIPVFLDTQLSRALNEKLTEPSYFNVIFERGIDPNVDDPTQCHTHSVVPDIWPEVDSITNFRDRVRARLFNVLNDPERYPMTRRLARVLFMTFEHEAMHLETLIYMLVQSPNTLPPSSLTVPWTMVGSSSSSSSSPSWVPPASWISVDPSTLDKSILSLGHNDSEVQDLLENKKYALDSEFGWDNENPLITCKSPPSAFKVQSRQVTNSEYLIYLEATAQLKDKNCIPVSWIMIQELVTPTTTTVEDIIGVKTVYGPVPLSISGEWPVSCSNIQATHYAAWLSKQAGQTLGLPTEHELSIVFKWKQMTVPKNGLENYGFRQWHPCLDQRNQSASTTTTTTTAATISDLSGPGGLWDWTCTPFTPLVDKKEFETSRLYPGYSSDFFDEKHMVVLGASWATHPRIAERRSFRNWYQANYPFVFAGFRLVQRGARKC
ncbi:hypothetical protein BGZ65_009870 [Modicella reniformis]|uniref:Uncharacterized protein n=1 Tax=Modicella reniformis TaxID=1440133 RepID=A0A9P6SUZ1_9FUNG|nr:hypothetical protein BGZ65_009870 [Modicella reniformis]